MIGLIFLAGVIVGFAIVHLSVLMHDSPYKREQALKEEIGRERIERLNAGLPPLR